jgi:hypothetical protein
MKCAFCRGQKIGVESRRALLGIRHHPPNVSEDAKWQLSYAVIVEEGLNMPIEDPKVWSGLYMPVNHDNTNLGESGAAPRCNLNYSLRGAKKSPLG